MLMIDRTVKILLCYAWDVFFNDVVYTENHNNIFFLLYISREPRSFSILLIFLLFFWAKYWSESWWKLLVFNFPSRGPRELCCTQEKKNRGYTITSVLSSLKQLALPRRFIGREVCSFRILVKNCLTIDTQHGTSFSGEKVAPSFIILLVVKGARTL